MRRIVAIGLFFSAATSACCSEVIDTFEPQRAQDCAGVDACGVNPNGWSWIDEEKRIRVFWNASGGNPNAYLGTGPRYFISAPLFVSNPAPETKLAAALRSGQLVSARFDYERLDAGACGPVNADPNQFVLHLYDMHSSDAVIDAFTAGQPSPAGPSAWETASFSIPFSATDVPEGWKINVNPDLGYTWQDLMHNVDAIGFSPVFNDGIGVFASCWRLGADNVVIAYGDAIFSDGFN